jgi:inner membrane protein involved in colicin E2 resistance
MQALFRIAGIVVVFVIISIAWLVLGGIMAERSNRQKYSLRGEVNELWGRPQQQAAPDMKFHWKTFEQVVHTETQDGHEVKVSKTLTHDHNKAVSPNSTHIAADIDLDQRLKGVMWYSLYDIDFEGAWTYEHESDQPGELFVGFQFPDANGLYDNFSFVVDGHDLARELHPENGRVQAKIPVEPGQKVTLAIGYGSRGMDNWEYRPTEGVSNLENFRVDMTTDFTDIDFPVHGMSPSARKQTDTGYALTWDFNQVVTGNSIGMVMPSRIQPGELASTMSLSAPVSLFFFFLVLFVFGTMRNIDIHPVNYLLLGGAFFSFHLLFSYSVDHLHVVPAFIIASVASIVLVVSYIRLVVSSRFAFLETGIAQLIYLVGFSLAHFWDGFTGLTVTVLSVLTLGVVMQLTGRIKWSEVFTKRAVAPGAMPDAPSAPPSPLDPAGAAV